MNQGRIIVITGAPGTGKTTVSAVKEKIVSGTVCSSSEK